MTDKEQIIALYKEMYAAMVNKDRAELERIHDDSFALTQAGEFFYKKSLVLVADHIEGHDLALEKATAVLKEKAGL